MMAGSDRFFAQGSAAVNLAAAEAGRTYRDAREVQELAALARECALAGPHQDIGRAQRTLARIGAICAGYSIGREGSEG